MNGKAPATGAAETRFDDAGVVGGTAAMAAVARKIDVAALIGPSTAAAAAMAAVVPNIDVAALIGPSTAAAAGSMQAAGTQAFEKGSAIDDGTVHSQGPPLCCWSI